MAKENKLQLNNIKNIELEESKQNEAKHTSNIINISMLLLELESDIRKKFKVLNGTYDNKEIFIKNNIIKRIAYEFWEQKEIQMMKKKSL